jgi:hypothetical protein
MKLLRRKGGHICDPTQDIGYRVAINGAEQSVRDRPVGPGAPVTFQCFIASDQRDTPACLARMAGEGSLQRATDIGLPIGASTVNL